MRTLSLALLIVGLLVFIAGVTFSLSIAEQVVEGVSGRSSSTGLWYILIGIALFIAGSALSFLDRRS